MPELIVQAIKNVTGVARTAAPKAVPVPGGTATKVGWAGTNVIYVGSDANLGVLSAVLLFTVRVPDKAPVADTVGLLIEADIGIYIVSHRGSGFRVGDGPAASGVVGPRFLPLQFARGIPGADGVVGGRNKAGSGAR